LVLLFHSKIVNNPRNSTDDTISNGTHKLHYLLSFQKNKGWKGGKLLKVWSISVGELSAYCIENLFENIFVDECQLWVNGNFFLDDLTSFHSELWNQFEEINLFLSSWLNVIDDIVKGTLKSSSCN
jgi:hypothetical protein